MFIDFVIAIPHTRIQNTKIVQNLIHKGQQSQSRVIPSIDVLQYTWIDIGNNVNTASPSTIYNYMTRI